MPCFRKTFAVSLFILSLSACGGGNSFSTTSSSSSSSSSSTSGATMTTVTLPRIDIDTLGNTVVDEPKVAATMRVTDYIAGMTPVEDFYGTIGIELRGSSSQTFFNKRNYGIEIRDAMGEGIDAAILGFPEEEDWVLHGPYSDKTLIRNTLMFDIGQQFDRYVSNWKYVDVYVNNVYEGVFVLLEKIKRDKNRINLSKLTEDDISGEELTGGYIIKLDKTNGEHEGNPSAYNLYTENMSFISNHGTGVNGNNSVHYFIYHYPHHSRIQDEQKTYIQNYIHAFENALAGPTFKDPDQGYRNYIDVDSFVDYFIATEISGNVDGFRLSTFLQKDKNGKLAMGPLWDYNLAFGNADYNDGWRTDLWIHRAEERGEGGVFGIPFWWMRLLEDEYFVGLIKARWNELRGDRLSDTALTNMVLDKTDYLSSTGALERNFLTWPVLGQYVWPNYYVGNTHGDEIGYLAGWLEARILWLDAQIAAL